MGSTPERSATPPRLRLGMPSLEGRELEYISDSVRSGRIAADGEYTRRCRELLIAQLGAPEVIMTTSCTDALEMAALLLDLRPGDIVVVPSFTFVSTALAFTRTGAQIVFCDIEPEAQGLDPAHLSEILRHPDAGRIRAVVVVHYAGVGADVDGLRLARVERPDVTLIEDNAHGLFGSYRGTPLGRLGRFATLSFHETKNFVCGEGGALILNDTEDIERAHVLLHKGTNRRAFQRGDLDRYTWIDTGSSFGMADILAAYLFGQLEQRERILAARRRTFELYLELLAPHVERLGVTLPRIGPDRESAYHMFHVLYPGRRQRDEALAGLDAAGIGATFHYVPLHSAPGAQPFLAWPTPCPVTDDIAGRLVRLPFHNRLSETDVRRVVQAMVGR